jgi:protein adenylyltransferase
LLTSVAQVCSKRFFIAFSSGANARMRLVNPAFIPRNHRIEAMIEAAVEREDFAPFEQLLQVLAKPFEDQASFRQYMDPPQPHERVCQTFCGT